MGVRLRPPRAAAPARAVPRGALVPQGDQRHGREAAALPEK